MFMSAAPTSAEPITQPDPNPGGANNGGRVGRLLTLVRKLIDYGKELAASLQHPGGAIDPNASARRFGTCNLARIVARITQGLHRAHALEERLVRNAVRLDAEPAPRRTPSPRNPRVEPEDRPRGAQPAAGSADAADPGLERLPTPEQIAAAVRRQPIGAVIADICRDLGILPNHPLWRELSREIIRHCGSLANLVRDILDRALPLPDRGRSAGTPLAPPAAFSRCPAPAGTGPP
jgi:hypothetical protein